MKKTLTALALALPFAAAFAQSHVAEAQAQTNSKPQIAAEAIKAAKKPGVAPIMDGSSGEGQGSGKDVVTASERAAEMRKDVREGMPHAEASQGSTPK